MSPAAIWFERPPLDFALPLLADYRCLQPAPTTPPDPFDGIAAAAAAVASVQPYTDAVLRRAPHLLAVVRTGIGYEKVDVAACTALGVAVCNVPDGPTLSTAEFAFTLMLTVAKSVKSIESEMRDALATGRKSYFYRDYIGVELHSKKLGLLGFGRIGRHMARLALGMGMTVAAYDPFVQPDFAAELGVSLLPLDALLASSDVVSVHLPQTAETERLMNAERFAQMRRGAIFINTARGGLVDEAALLAALDSGHLFGAGLDVTDPEPPAPDNPLLHRPNVIVTPHIASGTGESKRRIFALALDQVFMILRGERPPHLVNPDVWERVRARWEAQHAAW